MKYIINNTGRLIIFMALLISGGCTKNFESINTPPEGATDVSTPALFNGIISSLPVTPGEYSVLDSWIYPITQQGIVTSGAYPYDNAKSALWTNYYKTMASYRLIQTRISAAADSSTMKNLSAMLKTIMAYKTFKVTNYYGDMPYFKAGYAPLDGAVGYKVPYDKQADIYTAILTDLKWALDNFSTDPAQYSVGSSETFFQNDISKWTSFANSLRLYVAVTMYDKNNTLAASHITEALGKPLLADGQDVGLWPSNIPGLQFQWRQWGFSSNCYLRLGTTMWNLMSANNSTDGSGIFDPRCTIFYEPNNAGDWVPYPQNPTTSTPNEGGTPYSTDRFTTWTKKGVACIYSPFNLYFEQDLTYIPELMLTAAQVHFLKAEIYNRGLGTTADAAHAQTEYNAGVTASVNMWKSIAFNCPTWTVNKPASATASPAELTALLTNPVVAYDLVNADNALKQIYAQLWIDQYRQPGEAWTLLRRTGGLTPMSPDNAQYYASNFGTYNRFVYPDDEASYNRDNWKVATGGNDLNTNKIWIAK
ncbi:SusD/RagB family nutrient-binding outer membrane lipoprotein [Flavitalea flava]